MTRLIGFPIAADAWRPLDREWPQWPEQFEAAGLTPRRKVTVSDLGDITGAGRGAGAGRIVSDTQLAPLAGRARADVLAAIVGESGERVTLHTSPGHGLAVLRRQVGTFKRGPRRGLPKFKVVSVRKSSRGRTLGTLARATGTGLDDDQRRELDLAAWLAPILPGGDTLDAGRATARARIVSELSAEGAAGAVLLAIGKRAAKRQGQRLLDLRGVRASDTSLQDAASDAVAGILSHVRRLDKVTDWQSKRLWRVLALYGGRAAFRSLASWARVGMTGIDNKGASSAVCQESGTMRRVGDNESGTGETWASVFGDALASMAASDAAEDGALPPMLGDSFARWRLACWVSRPNRRPIGLTHHQCPGGRPVCCAWPLV